MFDHIVAISILAVFFLLLRALIKKTYRALKRPTRGKQLPDPPPPRGNDGSTSPLIVGAVRPLGSKAPSCVCCQYGRLISFNWNYPGAKAGFDHPTHDAFVLQQKFRVGNLYRCKECGAPWHLDAQEEMMSAVNADRVDLLYEWNRAPIILSQENIERLRRIGATPPDIYGNGRQYKETPCSVTTATGERIDLAIVSEQAHAPFEIHRNYRLGSEIAAVEESPYALPLDVRIASSRAEEMSMGFAPTIIEMPDGKRFILNWSKHFLVKVGYRAADARVVKGSFSPMPEFADEPKETVYFVVDG